MKNVESATSDFYSQISSNSSLKFPDLSALFERLALEERIHEKRIAMFQQIQADAADAFIELAEAEAFISDYLKQLKMISEHLLSRFDSLTPRDILHSALEMENHIAETHDDFIYRVRNESVLLLVKGLREADADHRDLIKAFLAALP